MTQRRTRKGTFGIDGLLYEGKEYYEKESLIRWLRHLCRKSGKQNEAEKATLHRLIMTIKHGVEMVAAIADAEARS